MIGAALMAVCARVADRCTRDRPWRRLASQWRQMAEEGIDERRTLSSNAQPQPASPDEVRNLLCTATLVAAARVASEPACAAAACAAPEAAAAKVVRLRRLVAEAEATAARVATEARLAIKLQAIARGRQGRAKAAAAAAAEVSSESKSELADALAGFWAAAEAVEAAAAAASRRSSFGSAADPLEEGSRVEDSAAASHSDLEFEDLDEGGV